MRAAFEDALRRSPSHPLAPAIKRALSHKPREFGGWTTNARGGKRVKRNRT